MRRDRDIRRLIYSSAFLHSLYDYSAMSQSGKWPCCNVYAILIIFKPRNQELIQKKKTFFPFLSLDVKKEICKNVWMKISWCHILRHSRSYQKFYIRLFIVSHINVFAKEREYNPHFHNLSLSSHNNEQSSTKQRCFYSWLLS